MINTINTYRTMKVPNWQHHSKKEQKRTLKPQALRQAKARLAHLKKLHTIHPRKVDLQYYGHIQRNTDVTTRNQINPCQTTCN